MDTEWCIVCDTKIVSNHGDDDDSTDPVALSSAYCSLECRRLAYHQAELETMALHQNLKSSSSSPKDGLFRLAPLSLSSHHLINCSRNSPSESPRLPLQPQPRKAASLLTTTRPSNDGQPPATRSNNRRTSQFTLDATTALASPRPQHPHSTNVSLSPSPTILTTPSASSSPSPGQTAHHPLCISFLHRRMDTQLGNQIVGRSILGRGTTDPDYRHSQRDKADRMHRGRAAGPQRSTRLQLGVIVKHDH